MFDIRREACALALCGLALAIGCDKKKDTTTATPSGGMPALDQPQAATGTPGDHPVHPPTGATGEAQGGLPPGHPPIMPGATMGGSGASAAGGAGFDGTTPGGDFDAKTVVAGVIKLDGKMKD